MSAPPKTAMDELVPLADRLRYLQAARLAIVAAFAAYAATVPSSLRVAAAPVAVATVAYLSATAVGHLAWHLRRSRGITLFGALLIADGFALAGMAWATGGVASPVRYLTLVHLVTVALLASYRTAVKIAFWHSMLALGVLELTKAGVLAAPSGALPGGPARSLGAFLALAWTTTLAAAAFAAVNERELRRRKVDLEALARLATALERTSTVAGTARTLHDALVDAFGFRRLAVLVVDGDEVVTAHDDAPVRVRPAAVVQAAWDTRRTQLVARVDLGSVLAAATNVLVVPLFADGGALGAVVAEHGARRGGRIERRIVEMVERFCDHAALALRTAALVQELHAAAAVDGLTGVANRRTFEQALHRELDRSVRTGEPVSLVMVDIDHFKALNDRHGHQAGDAVLRAVATALGQACRSVDLVARYGGEEFAVVLPDCAAARAAEAAERLRAELAAASLPTAVTASFGVATAHAGAPADALVRAADAALYTAKRRGRDRVVVARAPAAAAAAASS